MKYEGKPTFEEIRREANQMLGTVEVWLRSGLRAIATPKPYQREVLEHAHRSVVALRKTLDDAPKALPPKRGPEEVIECSDVDLRELEE